MWALWPLLQLLNSGLVSPTQLQTVRKGLVSPAKAARPGGNQGTVKSQTATEPIVEDQIPRVIALSTLRLITRNTKGKKGLHEQLRGETQEGRCPPGRWQAPVLHLGFSKDRGAGSLSNRLMLCQPPGKLPTPAESGAQGALRRDPSGASAL